jgi:hypothetical protein
VIRVVAFANKSGRVKLDEWELREGQNGLSVFEKRASPPPSVVIAAVGLRKKGKFGLGGFVLKREDVWALGLRFVRTLGATGVPAVDAIHFDIRLSFFTEIGFSFRAEAKRQHFNNIYSPQLQAIARPLLE